MVKIIRGLAVVLLLVQVFAPLSALAQDGPPATQVLISEFQTGSIDSGDENPRGEFVELYNPTDFAADVAGWKVEYLTKTHDGVSEATRTLAALTGNIEPGAHLLISYQDYLADADFYFSGGPVSGYLAKGDGTIRMVNEIGQTIDLVGYGSPNNYEQSPAAAPDANKSLQRCVDNDQLVDTNNNSSDFALYSETTPGINVSCPVAASPTAPSGSNCMGIILSELLPNPAGTDGGNEFIELYNPTGDFINLAGCGLQYGSGSVYRFGNVELAPEQYKAFGDQTTGITLTNSSGGTVYLLSAIDEELATATYLANMGDDVSWAWFGADLWRQTYVPSPNAINTDQATKPCAYGEVRNPDTGRCVSLGVGGSTLQPCRADQERNPATNRCRLLTASAAKLTACKPGQERNPATNRCRSASSTQLKPCKPGQERNPDTNRCRNATGAAGGSGNGKVQDIASTAASKSSWWLGGLALMSAGAYGIWEWRAELRNLLKKLFMRPRIPSSL